jgi:8-oxo-dGTP pyrophosphatase MutT (NUDIX family)
MVRHPESGKWIIVDESRNRGFWLPGGFSEAGDSIFQTALKETKEEAGLDVVLRGVLRVEVSLGKYSGRSRVIFYAEPADSSQVPKSEADVESNGAFWASYEEICAFQSAGKLRGTEPLYWADYVERGGPIYPLEVVTKESAAIVTPAVMSTIGGAALNAVELSTTLLVGTLTRLIADNDAEGFGKHIMAPLKEHSGSGNGNARAQCYLANAVNVRVDADANTLLHVAVKHGARDIIAWLLEHNADQRSVNRNNQRSVDMTEDEQLKSLFD